MRVVVIVIAALMTLGLAAFGVVTAQKEAGPTSLLALATHLISSAKGTSTPPVIIATAAPRGPVVSDASPAPLVVAQNAPASAPAAVAAQTPAPAAAPASASQCSNPNALGLSRVVQIDTTGGPAFGTEHFKQYDFLRDKEVVLTFDDGPWPENTPAVLKALQDNCLKATFFEIGEHATWRPDLTKLLVAAGMTVGSHTWSHKDLAKNPYAKDIEQAKQEIEMGVSAVTMAAGTYRAVLPFSRSAAAAGSDHLSRHAQHCDVLDRHRLVRFQDSQTGRRHQVGADQTGKERQGYRADARLPEGHGGSDAATARAAQG
jgi:Polysaccharide deacetylase